MRFKEFDLNHLVALNHLLTERSVSRAAEQLGRSQSTVSGILARLREQFGDDLLVQMGREMVLTARGMELSEAVRNLLLQIDSSILRPSEFDPAVSDRAIRLFASDYMMIAGMADALLAINRVAPNLRFEVLQPAQNRNGSEQPSALLENGIVDLLTMPQPFLSPRHPNLPLFVETFCCLVCRENAAVGDTVPIEQFLQMQHARVDFGLGFLPSFEEWVDHEYGRSARQIVVTGGSFATLPLLLPGTQRIALVHRRLARAYIRILPLRIVEPGFVIPPLTEAIQWHQYGATDRALMWVRDQIVAAMARGPTAGDVTRAAT